MTLHTAAFLALLVPLALAAQSANPPATAFRARAVSHTATIRLAGSIDQVFRLFGPIVEKEWAPGWNPEIFYPTDREVAEGMVFVTHEAHGDAIWAIAHFDPSAHEVSYVNIVPGHIVNRIVIRCTSVSKTSVSKTQTDVSVTYHHVGLSETGNHFVDAMDDNAYAAKMAHWKEHLNYTLRTGKILPARN